MMPRDPATATPPARPPRRRCEPSSRGDVGRPDPSDRGKSSIEGRDGIGAGPIERNKTSRTPRQESSADQSERSSGNLDQRKRLDRRWSNRKSRRERLDRRWSNRKTGPIEKQGTSIEGSKWTGDGPFEKHESGRHTVIGALRPRVSSESRSLVLLRPRRVRVVDDPEARKPR